MKVHCTFEARLNLKKTIVQRFGGGGTLCLRACLKYRFCLLSNVLVSWAGCTWPAGRLHPWLWQPWCRERGLFQAHIWTVLEDYCEMKNSWTPNVQCSFTWEQGELSEATLNHSEVSKPPKLNVWLLVSTRMSMHLITVDLMSRALVSILRGTNRCLLAGFRCVCSVLFGTLPVHIIVRHPRKFWLCSNWRVWRGEIMMSQIQWTDFNFSFDLLYNSRSRHFQSIWQQLWISEGIPMTATDTWSQTQHWKWIRSQAQHHTVMFLIAADVQDWKWNAWK